jgi:glycosyltransferase involved in cell wall biosynthesis
MLFCPFTAPTLALADPRVPVVSTVCDLQHIDYPHFFTSDDRNARNRDLDEACQRADRIICISDFTRTSLLQHTALSPERATAIPIGVAPPTRTIPTGRVDAILDRLGLLPGRFLLYPANFWPHKNHLMLASAFTLYRNRHPCSDLKLVCTGALAARMEELRRFLQRTNVAEWIVLPGYLPADDLSALMNACLAVVFPSLYEGFGMPVLEAMHAAKPVLCSNRASLPEVAGDAALLFDPERPTEILASIERIDADPSLVERLATLGSRRVSALTDPDEMARVYWEVFKDVVDDHRAPADAVYGVYPDGWTGERVVVTYGARVDAQSLELVLTAPVEAPFDRVHAHVTLGDGDTQKIMLRRGETHTIVRALAGEGAVEVRVEPPFAPAAHGWGRDRRILGCVCKAVRILGPGGSLDLLTTSTH